MRIAIVNDLPLALEALRRVVAPPATRWPGPPGDGEEAVRRCAADRPDVVLMDLVMPVIDGAEATRRIMAADAVPGPGRDGQRAGQLRAGVRGTRGRRAGRGRHAVLGAGRVAPGRRRAAGEDRRRWAEKLKRRRGRRSAPAGRRPPAAGGDRGVDRRAGGGGRGARRSSRPDLPAAVLVVQHIDAEFIRRVGRVAAGAVALPGPGGRSRASGRSGRGAASPAATTTWSCGRTARSAYTPEPADSPFRPSVDVLFQSLAANAAAAGRRRAADRDGPRRGRGLLALRRAGWQTIAQDEATCVVYGMPEAAARLGAAGPGAAAGADRPDDRGAGRAMTSRSSRV